MFPKGKKEKKKFPEIKISLKNTKEMLAINLTTWQLIFLVLLNKTLKSRQFPNCGFTSLTGNTPFCWSKTKVCYWVRRGD